jgi:hypothetical protein
MTSLCLPAWMELLLNVIGYAGFIGLATWHKTANAPRFAAGPAAEDVGPRLPT